MLRLIDYFLDRITMYRLVLYYLIGLIAWGVILSFFGFLPFTPLSLLLSSAFLVVVSWITNKVFAFVFRVPTNVESVYITALILALIAAPLQQIHSLAFLWWLAVWAMASKYILAINKKHIFNPVAIAAVIVAFGLQLSVNWWVGTPLMMPCVTLGGLLVMRKIKRADLMISFFLTTLLITAVSSVLSGSLVISSLQKLIFQSSLLFFAFAMLTEPLTTPPTKSLRIWYGILVGVLFSPQFHLESLSFTPEQALVIGNIFSFLVSPKAKLLLSMAEKIQLGPDIYDFVFKPQKKLAYQPGQYMEWTLSHPQTDSRGNRRYFTLASSPTEDTLRLGVKFYDRSSSFKRHLLSLDHKTPVIASQLAGDFTLPKDPSQKIVFLAGGIGITPFRSMLKYLIDTNQPRDIIVIYANKRVEDIIYTDVLLDAAKKLKIKTLYTLTDKNQLPPHWPGKVGRVDSTMIKENIPDFQNRIFYLSGPHAMITGFQDVLSQMGVPPERVKTDYFPGFV